MINSQLSRFLGIFYILRLLLNISRKEKYFLKRAFVSVLLLLLLLLLLLCLKMLIFVLFYIIRAILHQRDSAFHAFSCISLV